MNETSKYALSFALAAAAVGYVWKQADFEYRGIYNVWLAALVASLTLLLGTFDFSSRNLQRLAGVLLLLAGLLLGLGFNSEGAFSKSSLLILFNRWGELGIICVGAGLLIVVGGIDLSVGSLVGFAAVTFGILMERGWHPLLALLVVLVIGFQVGAVQGLLVTQLRLQAFLVTLCGMFVFRGLARSFSKGQTGMVPVLKGFEEHQPDAREMLLNLRYWLTGQDPATERLMFPAQLVVFLTLAAITAVLLHRTSYGRYWNAIGYNEQAARYAGVNTWRHKIFVFAVCSGLAALAGIILFLSSGSVSPSTAGEGYELYAITAVVLGGVSLRGGEGTSIGIVLGAMVLPFLRRLMNATECPDEWIPWLIGLILLGGTIIDELIRRRAGVNR